MTMTHQEAGRMKKLSTLKDEIDEYAEKYRPKILEQHTSNGYTYTRYEAAHADGCGCHQWVKGTGRNGGYEI